MSTKISDNIAERCLFYASKNTLSSG